MQKRSMLLIMIGAAMTSLLFLVRPVSPDAHQRITGALGKLESLEANRDEELVALRFGLSPNYDRLALIDARIREVEAGLAPHESSFTEEDMRLLNDAINRVFERAHQKSESAQDFASVNAAFVNALRVLPSAVHSFLESKDPEEKGMDRLEARLEHLQGLLYRYTLTRSSELRKLAKEEIEHLREKAKEPGNQALGTAIFLAEIIAESRSKVDDALSSTLDIDVASLEQEASQLYAHLRAAKLRKVERTQWSLLASFLGLLAFLGYTLVAYDKLNSQIEKRVIQRTSELAESREDLRSLVESTEAIPWIWDLEENRFRYVGPQAEALLGVEASEWLSPEFWTTYAGEESQGSMRRHAGENGYRELEQEITLLKPDGEKVWLRSIAGPAEEHQLRGFLFNITERRKIELQMQHTQKLESIGRLASGIAHEVNTPTQYVGDNTRFLREALDELDPVFKLAQRIGEGDCTEEELASLSEAVQETDLDYLFEEMPRAICESLEGIDRVGKIVRAMKEFSHPGSQEMAAADINSAIESTITVASNEWKYVAKMELDLAPDLPPVHCHVSEVNQVVLNMIVNASHAIEDTLDKESGSEGTIRICTAFVDDFAEIRISDTGGGIPKHAQDKIFDPFFTTKEVGKGTGQGLSMAFSVIVQGHGGTLDFETEEGKGTTFVIRLPLCPENRLTEAL